MATLHITSSIVSLKEAAVYEHWAFHSSVKRGGKSSMTWMERFLGPASALSFLYLQ